MNQSIFLFVLLLHNFALKANLQSVLELAEKCLLDEHFSKINLVADLNSNDEILQQLSETFFQHQFKYTGSKVW